MKLTQKTVETALYEGRSHMSKSGRKRWSQHVLWDDGLPGFGLRITPTNRKSFIISYRAGGRKRTKSLGTPGKLKLDEARRQAAELLASLAEEPPGRATGQPAAEGVATVAQLADVYLEQHLKGNVPSWYADQRLMQTHIKPAMGRSPVAEVTRTDLANLRSRVGRRFPADARRLASLLGGMFEWAAERGLWSKSSRGGGPAGAAPPDAPRAEPEPAAEPAPPATAEELQEGLERSERERRRLAERLDEVSASGVEMLAKLTEQAAAHKELETELARRRRELKQAQAANADRPVHEETEKKLANLRESVEQLMASLREARSARREMAEKLAKVEARARARGGKTAALIRRRDKLEARLLEEERQTAILKSQRRGGRERLALGLLAGAIGGALLMLAAQRVLAPQRPVTPVPASRPAAAIAGGTEAPVGGLGGAGGGPPAATAPDSPAATAGAGPVNGTGDGAPDFATAEDALRSWAAAWSEQRVDDYLAAYSQEFAPADGLGRVEWAAQRRERILRPAAIRVILGALRQAAIGADRVRIDFEQAYETETYADEVRKSIELVWEDGGWRIAAERTR